MNNLEMMQKRLNFMGGARQEDRMIKGKRQTLDRVVLYSYQACDVARIPYDFTTLDIRNELIGLTQEESEKIEELRPITQHWMRALINPDKTSDDYDEKVISIPYECGLTTGDIFKWKGTNSYWLVTLAALNEDAYFRSDIRRCRWRIHWKDDNGEIQGTWMAIRGPVETKINSLSKGGLSVDTPNLTLNILMPLNEHTLAAFNRYSRFLFRDLAWQVQAVDSVSMENVLEITAMEHYINDQTDDADKELEDGLVIEPIDPNEGEQEDGLWIEGESFIRPSIEYTYTLQGVENPQGKWSVTDSTGNAKIMSCNSNTITIKWDRLKSGQFLLTYSEPQVEKTIVVESLI